MEEILTDGPILENKQLDITMVGSQDNNSHNQKNVIEAGAAVPDGLNDTNVVLIPKKKSPITMGDLRPISLCNVLVKIITKVLANRMKTMLDGVVAENQSAFIPGRLIKDNIMVGYEMIHYLKRKRRGKKGFMALKIDMSKVYDRIE